MSDCFIRGSVTSERLKGLVEDGSFAVTTPTVEAGAALSIAISLKRIADTLCGDAQNTGLVQTLDYIQQRLGPQS